MKKLVWKDMSNESTSVLEWLESPITNKKLTLVVEKNKVWTRQWTDLNIMVTEKIFDEIKRYISQEEDIVVIENSESKLIFKLA